MTFPAQRFQDQVVVVTGATDGIGRATARAFAAEGARVVGTGRDQGRLYALQPEVDLALTLDVTDAAQVAFARDAVVDRYGRVDVVVCNAGQGLFARWDQTSDKDLRRLLEVNVVGVARVAGAFLPDMVARKGGTLVVIASIAGLAGYPEQTAYCASKHAVLGWARALRAELKGTGVRVVVVCPPVVETRFFERAGAPDFFQKYTRRRLQPDEAARGIVDATARGAPEVLLSWPSAISWVKGAAGVPRDLLSRLRR